MAEMLYGLLGEKLGHSCSPQIHRMLGDYDYRLFPVNREDLDVFLRETPFRGLNVTIPYKETVMGYCDRVSDQAQRIGSVNTLLREPDGSLYGHNTDYDGLSCLLERNSVRVTGKKVLVLGSGGTSRTARTLAENLQARQVVTVSRTGEVTYANLEQHRDAQVILNTTPVGMYPKNGAKPLELHPFTHLESVVDVVYNPLRTPLVQEGQQRGIVSVGGLAMLVAQAWASSGMFTGKAVDKARVEDVYEHLVSEMENLVLIGMPGSGKTTLGKLAAERLKRDFVDTDAVIAQRSGMSIPEIFAQFGEMEFRRREREVIAEYGAKTGQVIATGGGAVLDKNNLTALRQNGWLCHIKRDRDLLATGGRPLSMDAEALRVLEEKRMPIYRGCCQWELENRQKPLEQSAKEMLRAFEQSHVEPVGSKLT